MVITWPFPTTMNVFWSVMKYAHRGDFKGIHSYTYTKCNHQLLKTTVSLNNITSIVLYYVFMGRIQSTGLPFSTMAVSPTPISTPCAHTHERPSLCPQLQNSWWAILLLLCLCVHAFVMLFEMSHNFRNMHAMVWIFYIWIHHEKLGDHYFFLFSKNHTLTVNPLWNGNLIRKISQKGF